MFSGDGRSIFFVSDRGGAPQIYKVGASGGNAERVTFTGTYNISPSVSPDGRWLAYISRVVVHSRLCTRMTWQRQWCRHCCSVLACVPNM